MKKLSDFYESYITEYRTKKNPAEFNKLDGKPAEKNGTDGQMGINEPTDNTAQDVFLDDEEFNKNKTALLNRFATETDFFIMGEAGWGKTSIIKNMADKFGYEVLTVYLDKCEAIDVGGMPTVDKDKNGDIRRVKTLPEFAQIMKDNPDKKFLLFLDEMNQAAPDVQNALMPIILEHEVAGVSFDNFFVGAAGNYEYENDAVSKLSRPLESRLKPIIHWECDWEDAFKFIHKKWDEKVGKELVDLFDENHELFMNPREIEKKTLNWISKLKVANPTIKKRVSPESILDYLQGLVREELNRSQQSQLSDLADKIYEYIQSDESSAKQSSGRSGSRKDINMVSKELTENIRVAMTRGYWKDGNDTYGISKENIASFFIDDDEGEINAEMLERVIDMLEEKGNKFKYETDEEWKKKNPTWKTND